MGSLLTWRDSRARGQRRLARPARARVVHSPGQGKANAAVSSGLTNKLLFRGRGSFKFAPRPGPASVSTHWLAERLPGPGPGRPCPSSRNMPYGSGIRVSTTLDVMPVPARFAVRVRSRPDSRLRVST